MAVKILYDYQTFSLNEYGGISRYFHEISTRIADSDDFDVEIVCPLYIDKFFKNHPSSRKLVRGIPVNRFPKTNALRKLLNENLSNLLASISGADVVHETYYGTKSIGGKNAVKVITVYDMIHEKFLFTTEAEKNFIRTKTEAIKRANHVICISENTKKDLIERLQIDEKNISTIYLAHTPSNSFNETIVHLPLINNPYLLYVGNRGEYKNFMQLLKAYSESQNIKKDFQLVCFGGGKFSKQEMSEISRMQLQDKVIQISGDDDRLARLYRSAVAFIYPSLYEGFGIPLLEAMYYDCPVICSNISSIPEVVGNAGQFFDPSNSDSIINSIEKIIYSEEARNNLKSLGRERIKQFSWDLCAQQTKSVYQSFT
jgi:glycosyltransferase involved in cell wall biosynthesis